MMPQLRPLWLLGFALLGNGCSSSPTPPRNAAAARPHILLLVTEGLGIGDLSCYGGRRVVTPHIDRLAREGRRALQAYATSPAATASQHCLLSGLHSGHAALRRDAAGPAPAGSLPLFGRLRRAGYRTGFVGIWRQGGPDSSGAPLSQGVGHFAGVYHQQELIDHFPGHLYIQARRQVLRGNQGSDPRQFLSDELLVESQRFLESRDRRPFFLYLHLPLPQPALQVPVRLLDAQRGRLPQPPHPGGLHPTQPHPRAARAAMLQHLDRQVGVLLELLEEQQRLDRTLVILTSSHGPRQIAGADPRYFAAHGPHGSPQHSLSEGRLRVPLLMRWPERIGGGDLSNRLQASHDLLPTILSAAGAAAVPGRDGYDLLPRRGDPRGFLYWEHLDSRAVRMGVYKAIRRGSDTRIHNLDDDPTERRDLSHGDAQRRAQFDLILKTAHRPLPRGS